MHKCIICIGSNYNRKENLLLARRRLVDLFPTIRFTSEQETRPLFFRSPALFSNQVAMFFSEAEEERVRKELKAIEQSAGRRPEDKKEEKVSLDIDLLSFDDRVLKPASNMPHVWVAENCYDQNNQPQLTAALFNELVGGWWNNENPTRFTYNYDPTTGIGEG